MAHTIHARLTAVATVFFTAVSFVCASLFSFPSYAKTPPQHTAAPSRMRFPTGKPGLTNRNAVTASAAAPHIRAWNKPA